MVRWYHQLKGCESEQPLETGKDRGAWRAAVRGSQRNATQWPNNNSLTLLLADTWFVPQLGPSRHSCSKLLMQAFLWTQAFVYFG